MQILNCQQYVEQNFFHDQHNMNSFKLETSNNINYNINLASVIKILITKTLLNIL